MASDVGARLGTTHSREIPVFGGGDGPFDIEGEYGTEHTGESLYRSAFVPVLALILVGLQIGMARAALDQVTATLAKHKPISYAFYEDSAAAPITQLNLAEAAELIVTAHLHRCAPQPTSTDGRRRRTTWTA